MYPLDVLFISFSSFLGVLVIVLTVSWCNAKSRRQTDLSYIWKVAQAILIGIPIPTYGRMDKSLETTFNYIRQMAEDYQKLKKENAEQILSIRKILYGSFIDSTTEKARWNNRFNLEDMAMTGKYTPLDEIKKPIGGLTNFITQKVEKEGQEQIDEMVRQWKELKPQIITVPKPSQLYIPSGSVDSLKWIANFINGLSPDFFTPDVPDMKQSIPVKHNPSIDKPKAYFYNSSKTLGSMEMCMLQKSRIGSEYCLKRCDYYVAHGSNQKGRWIKCAQLSRALGK